MERAIDLAHFLVTGSLKKKSGVVEKLVSEKKRNTVNLDIPMPVYIRYFTAEVVDGGFHKYDDIYGRDIVVDESLTRAEVGPQK
jgi:murein L,D-transpeptidase YcbB/YkuD